MKKHQWQKVVPWLSLGTLSFLISLAILQGCGGGGGGGSSLVGGSDNGGGSVVNDFTVSPASAAPGKVVTLSGVHLNENDPVTIRFGDVSTTIESRTGSVQVVVPVFFNKGGTALQMPTAPVKVSVQIGDGIAKDATNSFTVRPLPAAPGTTAELVAQIKGFGAFLEDTAVNGMLPLTTGPNAVFDRSQVIQTIALARAEKSLLDGADNPNSLLALINGTAPLGGTLKLPKSVLDSVLAQTQAMSSLSSLATQFAAIVNAVEPTALSAGNGLRSSRIGARLGDGDYDFHRREPKIDWSKMTPAQRIIVMIQDARLLQSGAEKLGFLDNFNTNYLSCVGALAGSVPLPQFQGAAKLIQVESLIIAVVNKLASGFTALIPSKFKQFYIIVSGTNRKVGTAPINLVKGDTVQLDAYIQLTSTGGPIISPAGVLGLVLAKLSPKIVPEFINNRYRDLANAPATNFAAFLKTEKQLTALEGSIGALVGKVTDVIDSTWVQYTGDHPPKDYLDRGTLVVRLPAQALKPVKINDAKTTDPRSGVVTIEALGKFTAPVPPDVTTNDFLSVTRNGNGTYTLRALKSTSSAGAGFFGALRDVKILPDAPSLREIALDSGVNVNVKGVVTIACPNTRAGDCDGGLPPGCFVCGKGSTCDYDKSTGQYNGGCSATNHYPGCCSDYPCSPECVS